jgi:diguanylate cyclase (GGDEF)-like protein/PAS domain S-box-containing protein
VSVRQASRFGGVRGRTVPWILVPASYIAAGKLGLALAFVHTSATAVWPPTGIALAAFLLFGRRLWPAILAAAFVVNYTTAGSVLTCLGIAAGNTLEGVLGSWLVDRWAGGRNAFERPRSVFRFALAAGLAASVSATLGVASLLLGGLAAWDGARFVWWTWWLGDVGGALILAPLLILWAIDPRPALEPGRRREQLAAVAATVLTGAAIFGGLLPVRGYPVEFVALPPLLWASFRFAPREAASATALMSAIAVFGALQGYGPFVRRSPNETLLLLQAFMASVGVTNLAVAAAVALRRAAEAQASRLAAIVATSDDAIVGKTLDGVIVSWNHGAERLYGYAAAEVIGRRISMLVPPDLPDETPELIARIRAGGRVAHYETVRVARDGRRLAISLSISPVVDARGAVVGASSIARDVGETKRAEQRLRASEAHYRLLFERNLAGVYRATPEGRLLECNDAFARILGYATREEAAARHFDEFVEPEEWRRLLSELRAQGSLRNLELRLRRKDGSTAWALGSQALLREGSGAEFVEGALVEITERKLAEQQVEYRAHHDPLTGLPNRLYLKERAGIGLARARREGDRMAWMFLDLDDFKAVNDSLGHAAGDLLLREAATRLRACLREGDWVARVGGDEFVVLLPSVRSAGDAERIARKLIRVFDDPFEVGGRAWKLGVSVGIALYPDHGDAEDELVRKADAAMYRAKQAGRGGYRFFEE